MFEFLTGTASAAFLTICSLRKLAEDNSYSIGIKTVLNDFYVDDLVIGADTLQDILSIKDETILEGGFELQRRSSNINSSI